jgi:hypothetical protein
VLERLRQFFHVAHVHYNNSVCIEGIEPFPSWAYELLLVNKRIAGIADVQNPELPHAHDSPNYPQFPDCQPAS